MIKPAPALLLTGLVALVACGDDSATPGGSGGGTSSVTVSVSVSSAAATVASTSTATGSGGESTTGGDGGAGGGAGTSSGGQGGQGGAGGAPGTGGAGQGGSTTTGDPIDCVVCVATECPQIAECIADPACRDGLVCTLTGCIVDGQPDLVCIADCFGGDFAAALDAVEALACVVTTCGEGCGGLIPAG